MLPEARASRQSSEFAAKATIVVAVTTANRISGIPGMAKVKFQVPGSKTGGRITVSSYIRERKDLTLVQ